MQIPTRALAWHSRSPRAHLVGYLCQVGRHSAALLEESGFPGISGVDLACPSRLTMSHTGILFASGGHTQHSLSTNSTRTAALQPCIWRVSLSQAPQRPNSMPHRLRLHSRPPDTGCSLPSVADAHRMLFARRFVGSMGSGTAVSSTAHTPDGHSLLQKPHQGPWLARR